MAMRAGKSSNPTGGEAKYYDPAEVDAYVVNATDTIKALNARLLEATQRADAAEQALAASRAETESLGRALLLASDVADHTIVGADSQAAEIVKQAEERAALIIASAEAEARQVVDVARRLAAEHFRSGEARLLSAVNAFVEGSNLLREEMAEVAEDATSWRQTPPPPVPAYRGPTSTTPQPAWKPAPSPSSSPSTAAPEPPTAAPSSATPPPPTSSTPGVALSTIPKSNAEPGPATDPSDAAPPMRARAEFETPNIQGPTVAPVPPPWPWRPPDGSGRDR